MIDLHIHLDGSLSLNCIKKLAEMQGIEIEQNDHMLKELITAPANCKDLNRYLKCFDLPIKLLQSEQALKYSAKSLCEELKNQGLVYAEIRFAPQLHTLKGLTQEKVIESVLSGMKSSSLSTNLILCCMRGDNNKSENITTVKLAKKYINDGVCAIDLAGAEALYPTSSFVDVFALAKELNVPFTIHAGEADGAESIEQAIKFGAKRIGHGIHASSNNKVMDLLRKNHIVLEMCPTSNFQTKSVLSTKDYPLNLFLENNMLVTINTDNTTVSSTSIKKEFDFIRENYNISERTVKQLLLNAANASFSDEKTKDILIGKIEKRFS